MSGEWTERDAHWMRRALELARQGEALGEVPVGAVVVIDDQEVGAGFNAPISRQDPTAHAEVVALREAAQRVGNYRLPGATLYVTLEPCVMCSGALVHARISRLVYGASEPKAGAVQSMHTLLAHPAMNWRVEVCSGVLSEVCSTLLSAFFARRRQARRAPRETYPDADATAPGRTIESFKE